MADKPKQQQVLITLQDIQDTKYVFAKDVITEHMTGVSKSGSVEAESGSPASKFKARFHYEGATLQTVLGHADYQLGVNLRASLRGNNKKPAWIPEKGTGVDVFVTDGGKVQLKNLPTEVQAQMLFGGIEDEDTRKRAIKAFLVSIG